MTNPVTSPALEDRVVQALIAEGLIRRPRRRMPWIVAAAAAAAALVLFLTHPWTRGHAAGQTYVLLLSPGPGYLSPPPGGMEERRAEYGRWADSLYRLGKLDLEGHLEPPGTVVDGMFIIRAVDDSDAARIAATCPHNKYHGHIEVRRFVE